MFDGKPSLSPALSQRLPVTFATYFFDQVKDWHLLFPAEKNYFERLLTLIERIEAATISALFAPMREAERKMGVNEKVFDRKEFTLEHVDFLNRSPHYPEWRAAVAQVFAKLDPVLDEQVVRNGKPRLVVVIAPSDLPVGPDRMWLRIASRGKRVRLTVPEEPADYLPLLLTGAPLKAKTPTLASLYADAHTTSPYQAWSIEAGETLASMRQNPATSIAYARLERYRRRLMSEVNRIVDQEKIRGPRQLGGRLKDLRIAASESDTANDPVMAEYLRAVLLAGNGTLLVNNTFVEWATVQAVRRARPSVALLAFGIRNKVKPFSSVLIYTDQDAANPIPTQMDTLGSYVDLEVFYQYIWQEFEKYAEYRRNTAYLFVGDGLDEMLVIAPPDFALLQEPGPVSLTQTFKHARSWLGL
jgi:hypothetical protein